jgi:hypothetical protein
LEEKELGKLTNLLKWHKQIIIKDEKGLIIRDQNNNPIQMYMRVIGDKDLEDAMLKARFASAQLRKELANLESEQYLANVAVFSEATKEQCIEMIVQGRAANWAGEAFSVVKMPDLPEIKEIAIDPDAPTLEELEKLDNAIFEVNTKYQKELALYVESREKGLRTELKDLPLEELQERAKNEVIIVMAVSTYLDTLADEKIWRSVYQDEEFTIPEFNGIEEFQNLHSFLKDQLRQEYSSLEQGLDEIKN